MSRIRIQGHCEFTADKAHYLSISQCAYSLIPGIVVIVRAEDHYYDLIDLISDDLLPSSLVNLQVESPL